MMFSEPSGLAVSPPLDHQRLHQTVWRRLQTFASRPTASPAEILLYGPMGVGKSILLDRLYWDIFAGLDVETPLLIRFPPSPFRPRTWSRRFLMNVCQQWVGFERRDAALARGNLLPPSTLSDLCRRHRLDPLAEALEDTKEWEDFAEDPSFLLEQTLETVSEAASRMRRRALLLLDAPENATWRENEEVFHLTRLARPLPNGAALRRIWAMRSDTPEVHPYLAPTPLGTDPWLVPPLSVDVAAEFVSVLARAMRLDYDDAILTTSLGLWGGIPRWLANFVRKAAELPHPLSSPEQVLQVYAGDIREGLTARDLQAALNPPTGPQIEPATLARVARTYVLQDAVYTRATRGKPASPVEETALQRLAQTGLALYGHGLWGAPATPLLVDFLHLYVAQHLAGEDMARVEIALRRKRLMEIPLADQRSTRERRLEQVRLLLHTFRGQAVPAHLLRAHRSRLSETGGVAKAPAQPVVAADERNRGAETFRLPHCIGAFLQETPTEGAAPGIPAVVGWCFDQPGYFRSDEAIWVAHLCDVSVVTSEEVDQIERTNKHIGRELGVGRTVGWIITEGRLSVEAVQRISERDFHVSSWRDCETIGEMILTGREAVPTTAWSSPEESELEDEAADEQTPPPSAHAGPALSGDSVSSSAPPTARVVDARPSGPHQHVVELRLPPRADMELIAANNIEHLGASCGFPAKAITQMRMATLEACLNAIEHSRNTEKDVRVRLEAGPTKFTILVENEGMSFDPQAVEDPRIEEKLAQSYKRGWGIKLIRKFMDKVVFEPYDRGTRLRMEKYNPSSNAREPRSHVSKA